MPSTGLLSRGLVGWDVTLASTWTISLNIDVSKKKQHQKKVPKIALAEQSGSCSSSSLLTYGWGAQREAGKLLNAASLRRAGIKK